MVTGKFKKINWRRVFKIFGWSMLTIIVSINLIIIISGKFHIYRAIANTIFQGRLMPDIHEQAIFENRVIVATNPTEWKTHQDFALNTLDKLDVERFNSIETESFLVIKNDSLFFERYWEEYNEQNMDSLSNSFSVAKSVISALVGIAIDEGKIGSIDDPIGKYVESYNSDGLEKITIRHLLTMSSGLNWDESPSPFSDNTEAYYGWDLEKLMNKQSVEYDPGEKFEYMSGNTQLLGFALKEATGMTLSKYLEEKLWGPLGCTSNALWNLDDDDGHEKAFCCLYSTSRDFARIGQLYLQNGNWHGKQLIPEAWVKQSITPADLINEDGSENTKYGLSWWITEFKGLPVFYARGILGQYIICIPKYELVVVRTGYNRGEKLPSDHPEDVYWYIEAALKMIDAPEV